MDVLERLTELLIKQGIEKTSVIDADDVVRREYGGSSRWVAKRSSYKKEIAIDTLKKTGNVYQAAKISGYSISNVYNLFKKHRGK